MNERRDFHIKEFFLLLTFVFLGIIIVKGNLFIFFLYKKGGVETVSSLINISIFQLCILLEIFCLLFIFAIKIKKYNLANIGIIFNGYAIKSFIYGLLMAIPAAFLTWFMYIKFNHIVFSFSLKSIKNLTVILFPLMLANAAQAGYEELLFRSWVLTTLAKIFNQYNAIIILGLLFGVMHFLNPNYKIIGVFNSFLVGSIMSYVFLKSGTIWMSYGMHFGWNFLMELLNNRFLFKYFTSTRVAYSTISEVESTIFCTAAIVSLLIIAKLLTKYYLDNDKRA